MSGSVIASIIIGVLLTAVAFAHPIGPGLMLAAETPFDSIPFAVFGVLGNLITFVPILILLIKVNPASWGRIFLGTRIQQLLALFIMVLLVSHAQLIVHKGAGEILEWLRKVTLFILIGVFAYSMRQTRYLPMFVKTMVISMALFTFLSSLDFHLGIQVLPIKAGRLATAALDTEYQNYLATDWRFTGAGYPVNRFSNYLVLVIFLGVGWFMYVKGPMERTFALGCTALLVVGELLTASRSGTLAVVVGTILLMPLAFRLRVQQVIGIVLIGGIVGALIWYAVSFVSGSEVLAKRFGAGSVSNATGGRIERVLAALQIWALHPFLGVGWGSFTDYSWKYITGSGIGAHNAYTRVLAEAGLLGFVPMVMVLVAILRRHFVSVAKLSRDLEFWRPYFLAGLIGQLVMDGFNDYFWERYLWVSFAFTVVLEQCYQTARAQQARAGLEQPGRDRGVRAPEPLTATVRAP